MAITRQTTNLTLDFKAPNRAQIAHAKQNDKLSRFLVCQLTDGGLPWTAPANIMAAIRFRKPDGTAGFYDVDELNRAAVVFSGSVVTLTLAEQALTVAGDVYMELNVYTAQSEKLTTFSWTLRVEQSVLTDAVFQSTSYYNILTQQIADILGRVQSIAGLTASATGVAYGTGTSVVVTGGTGASDPYNLNFQIEKGFSPTAVVSKSGHDVTFTATDINGTTTEQFVEPQATVSKVDDVITISMTDVDGTTSATLLSAAVRLCTFAVDLATGQLVMTAPSDYTEMSWAINASGELIATY